MVQSKAQQQTVKRVMHEFSEGKLKIGISDQTVKNPRQAIAIALREAGASNQETPAKNRKNLRHTKTKERAGKTAEQISGSNAPTKSELYERAKTLKIPGRSSMSKAELERAVQT